MFWPVSTCSSSVPNPSGEAWLSRTLGFSTVLTPRGRAVLTWIEHLLCTLAPAMDTAVSNRPCQRPSGPLFSPSSEAPADKVTFKAVLSAKKSRFFPGSLGVLKLCSLCSTAGSTWTSTAGLQAGHWVCHCWSRTRPACKGRAERGCGEPGGRGGRRALSLRPGFPRSEKTGPAEKGPWFGQLPHLPTPQLCGFPRPAVINRHRPAA